MTDWSFDYEKRDDAPASSPGGILLGEYVRGDFPSRSDEGSLFVEDGQAFWLFDENGEPSAAFGEPIGILGRPGTGKTGTAWTFLDLLAHADPDSQQIVIDNNADFLGFGQRFGASMVATGRTPFFFPYQRLNGWPRDRCWPGDSWQPIYNSWLEIIPFAEKEGAAFYTDASSVALQLACRLGGESPKSTKELFERLDYDVLLEAAGPEELKGVTAKHVEALYMRCKSAYSHFGKAFDGELELADIDSGYFGIDALVLGKSAVVVMRKLLSQLSYYIEHVKDPKRRMVIVIDEFASLDGRVDLGTFIEHARKYGVCVIVMSQTVPGIGNSSQVARVLNNAGLVLVHATAEWSEIAHLMGRQIVPEVTLSDEPEGDADRDRLRLLEKAKVSPDELLALPRGHLVALQKNRATLLNITLPDSSGYEKVELPEQEELFDPIEWANDPSTQSKPPQWLDMPPRRFRAADFEIPEGAGAKPPDTETESSDEPNSAKGDGKASTE